MKAVVICREYEKQWNNVMNVESYTMESKF